MHPGPTDPYGLEWYKMLALYSDAGNKSNSHAKKCELGEELKKLDGKHELVIQGINDKIDSLISRGGGGGASISDADLVDLKEKIVAELGKVALDRIASAASEPVTCNFDGVVWTPDALDALKTTVRSVMESAPLKDTVTNGFSRQGQLLGELKESLKSVSRQERVDVLSKNLGDRIEAISSKIDDWKEGPPGSEGSAVIKEEQEDSEEVPELQKKDWLNVLEAQADSLTALAAEQENLRQTVARGFKNISNFLGDYDEEANMSGEYSEEANEAPREYGDEIYSKSVQDVIQMFKDADSALMIKEHPPNDVAKAISAYRKNRGAQATEISEETLREVVSARVSMLVRSKRGYPSKVFEMLMKKDSYLPIEKLRIMHVIISNRET